MYGMYVQYCTEVYIKKKGNKKKKFADQRKRYYRKRECILEKYKGTMWLVHNSLR